ncbi:hypothetical protein [Arthrobacter sp. CDRTa11]|uniref:hypothetical protein n=1 Tax=Arthrobacter sp. CDRTa11 TaxID=2651199 RepID=UPI002265EE16|nr:hypothetical protein [Arthrobacter sp. CDRTa11]
MIVLSFVTPRARAKDTQRGRIGRQLVALFVGAADNLDLGGSDAVRAGRDESV